MADNDQSEAEEGEQLKVYEFGGGGDERSHEGELKYIRVPI